MKPLAERIRDAAPSGTVKVTQDEIDGMLAALPLTEIDRFTFSGVAIGLFGGIDFVVVDDDGVSSAERVEAARVLARHRALVAKLRGGVES